MYMTENSGFYHERRLPLRPPKKNGISHLLNIKRYHFYVDRREEFWRLVCKSLFFIDEVLVLDVSYREFHTWPFSSQSFSLSLDLWEQKSCIHWFPQTPALVLLHLQCREHKVIAEGLYWSIKGFRPYSQLYAYYALLLRRTSCDKLKHNTEWEGELLFKNCVDRIFRRTYKLPCFPGLHICNPETNQCHWGVNLNKNDTTHPGRECI